MKKHTLLKEGAHYHSIITLSREIIKAHWQLLIVGGIMLWSIITAFTYFFEQAVGPEVTAMITQSNQPGFSRNETMIPMDMAAASQAVGPIFLMVLATVLVTLLVNFAVIFTVFDHVAGNIRSLDARLRDGLHRFVPYIGTQLLQFVCLLILFALLIIPGLIFSVFWYFTQFIVLQDKKSGWSAMKASKELVQGRWRQTFGIMILLLITAIVVMILVTLLAEIVTSIIPDALLGGAITDLVSTIFQLCVIVVMTVFFLRRDATKLPANK